MQVILVICLGDFIGHMCRYIDQFGGVYEGYGIGQKYGGKIIITVLP